MAKVVHGPITTKVEDFDGDDAKVVDIPLEIHSKGAPKY